MLTVVAVIFATSLIITSLNFNDIRTALAEASPWWALVSFGLGLLTFLGSALTVVAFAPVKLSLWRTTQAQAAAAYVALGAHAGIGHAAINLRLLTKRGVSNALGVASVGLVQLAQLVTTVILLVVLMLVSGSDLPLSMPPRTVLLAIGLVALAMTAIMFVPPARQWLAARITPIWQTTWPRLVQLIGQPKRFTVAVLGSLVMTLGYLGAFWAAVAAFGLGGAVAPIDIAIAYLFGNMAGAVIPAPGGLGPVEAGLVTGLTTAGISVAIGAPIVLLFRFLTFWLRIPIGWVAMKVLRRTGDL